MGKHRNSTTTTTTTTISSSSSSSGSKKMKLNAEKFYDTNNNNNNNNINGILSGDELIQREEEEEVEENETMIGGDEKMMKSKMGKNPNRNRSTALPSSSSSTLHAMIELNASIESDDEFHEPDSSIEDVIGEKLSKIDKFESPPPAPNRRAKKPQQQSQEDCDYDNDEDNNNNNNEDNSSSAKQVKKENNEMEEKKKNNFEEDDDEEAKKTKHQKKSKSTSNSTSSSSGKHRDLSKSSRSSSSSAIENYDQQQQQQQQEEREEAAGGKKSSQNHHHHHHHHHRHQHKKSSLAGDKSNKSSKSKLSPHLPPPPPPPPPPPSSSSPSSLAQPRSHSPSSSPSSKQAAKSGGGKKRESEEEVAAKKMKSSSQQQRSRRSKSRSSRSRSASADSNYDSEYFKRMAARSKDPFQDPTDKELFVENIWRNVKGRELELCEHRHSADCIIWLIEHCRDAAMLKRLTEDLPIERLTASSLARSSTQTMMLETLIDSLIRLLTNEKTDFDSATARWTIKYLDSFARLICDNLAELLATSMNGLRVTIAAIEAIGGIRIGRHWNRQNMRFGTSSFPSSSRSSSPSCRSARKRDPPTNLLFRELSYLSAISPRGGGNTGSRINLVAEIEKDITFAELPSSFKHQLKRFARTLVLDCAEQQIRELLFGRATQVAQYLLFILKVRYPELCQMVVKKMVETVFGGDEEDVAWITQSAPTAYIVEIILMVASETRLSKIWTKYLKGKLEILWKHDIANFIVQRMIDAIRDENLFNDVCKEIFPSLSDIFRHNRAGIGVCLAKACQEFKKMQPEFVTALMKAYSCYEPKDKQLDFVPSILFVDTSDKLIGSGSAASGPSTSSSTTAAPSSLGPPSSSSAVAVAMASKIQIWLHGSLMLQYMMSYSDPSKACRSLLSLSTFDIVRIARDRSGSHIVDAMLHSDTVPLKYKSEIVERFLGQYHTLSMDKFGSRIVENILALSDQDVKRAIMSELSDHESRLNANRNGWFVAKKFGLHHYKHRPADWESVQQAQRKRKRVFADFIATPGGSGSGSGSGAGPGPTPDKFGFVPFKKRYQYNSGAGNHQNRNDQNANSFRNKRPRHNGFGRAK